MASVDVHTPSDASVEEATKTVERWQKEGISEEEQLKYLEDAIKALGEPGNVDIFRAAMEEIGVRAVKTDEAFARVKNTMDGFVERHGAQFPGIVPFQTEWHGYASRWNEYITTSRDLAIKTAAEYEDYTLYLEQISIVQIKEDKVALANGLVEFSKNKPVGIPIDLKDKFLGLRREVESFQNKFNKYLEGQAVELTADAEQLRKDIDALKSVIEGLDKQIGDATIGLGVSAFFGPLGMAIAGTVLAVLASKRKSKQKELDGKKEELRKNEIKQTTLAEIKAQFAGLVPDFELLSTNLGLFADVWNAFHNEAVTFSSKFQKLSTASSLPITYLRQVEAAIAVSGPLTKGLKAYAASIQ